MKTFKIHALLLFLIITTSGYAQYGDAKPAEIEELKTRKLIVVKEPYSEAILDNIDGEQEESYKQIIDAYNSNFQEAIKATWPYHEDFEVMLIEDAYALQKSKNKEYAILRIASISVSQSYSHASQSTVTKITEYDGITTPASFRQYETKAEFGYNAFFIVSLIEDLKKKPITSIGLPNSFPTRADIAFAVQYTSWLMETKLDGGGKFALKSMIKENAGRLANYTLYIRESDLSNDYTAKDVDRLYPYKFKIVSNAEFDSIVLSQPEQTAYAVVIPYLQISSNTVSTIFITLVFDAHEGVGCSMVEPGFAATRGFDVGKGSSFFIDDKVLEEIVDDIAKARN